MNNNSFFETLKLHRVINAAGRMTYLGASTQSEFVLEAMIEASSHYVDMEELFDIADRFVANITGAEAGFITSCSAAGIAIATAACVSQGDRTRAERIPGPMTPPNEIVLQKAHAIHFGAELTQMVRLGGAKVVEVGTANRVLTHHVADAINANTAAVMVAVSHHAPPEGALRLAEIIQLAHAANVPVIVDAAAELDLRKYVAAGADLVIYSGHKGFGSPTAGIVAGRRDLIDACRLQNIGIGRAMKIGKENIVGCLAALYEHTNFPQESKPSEIDALERALQDVPGLTTSRVVDPTRPEIARLRLALQPAATGIDASTLIVRLSKYNPSVRVRGHGANEGYFDVDFRPLAEGEALELAAAIRNILQGASL